VIRGKNPQKTKNLGGGQGRRENTAGKKNSLKGKVTAIIPD